MWASLDPGPVDRVNVRYTQSNSNSLSRCYDFEEQGCEEQPDRMTVRTTVHWLKASWGRQGKDQAYPADSHVPSVNSTMIGGAFRNPPSRLLLR